uniref:Uncharacterized protein n=1 Tax=Glossina pallidipes TaxID=7398 RepID=A0A1A9ZMZ1_GLOPL
MAGRIPTSTLSAINVVAAARTQQTVMQTHNAATTDTALEDKQAKPMCPITSPQTPDRGPPAATPISSLQTTPTTPTLSIPRQIDHTFTNTTATTPTAAMRSVTAQASRMAVNINLTVCSPATIAALLPQLTGSLTLTVSEQREQLTLRHGPTHPRVTINDEPATVEGINEVALQIPMSQPSISIANTSYPTQSLGLDTCNSQTTPISPDQTAAAQSKLAPLLQLPARTQDQKSKPLGVMPQSTREAAEWRVVELPWLPATKRGPYDTRATEPLGAPPRVAHPRCNPATVQPNCSEHPEYGLPVEPPRRRMINLPRKVVDNAPGLLARMDEEHRSTGAPDRQTVIINGLKYDIYASAWYADHIRYVTILAQYTPTPSNNHTLNNTPATSTIEYSTSATIAATADRYYSTIINNLQSLQYSQQPQQQLRFQQQNPPYQQPVLSPYQQQQRQPSQQQQTHSTDNVTAS